MVRYGFQLKHFPDLVHSSGAADGEGAKERVKKMNRDRNK